MTAAVNRQIMLVEKPAGKLTPQNFRIAEAAIPEPKVGEVLVRVLYISLDAANRAWMQGITYREAVEANAVMAGGAIAEVVESKVPGFIAGDLVLGEAGWQDYAILSAEGLVKVPRDEPITHFFERLWHCGPHRLLRIAERRQTEARRYSCSLGRRGFGRCLCRPDCKIEGLPRHRDRWW